MKLITFITIALIVFSCSKEPLATLNNSHTSTNDSCYMIVNGTKHICNYILGDTLNGGLGYEVVLDSIDNVNTYYSMDFWISDSTIKTYYLNGVDIHGYSFSDYFILPNASIGSSTGSITVTNNSSGKLSGYFSGTFVFSPSLTDSVSGVFNNVKIN